MKEDTKPGALLFAWCLSLLPILSSYDSFISGVDIGTLIIVLFGIYLMIREKAKVQIFKELVPIFLYTAIRTILVFVFPSVEYSSEVDIIFRLMRFLTMLTIVIGMGLRTCYNEKTMITVYAYVAVISSFFSLVQFLSFQFLGIRIPGVFGNQIIRNAIIYSSYRPASFFGEPSNFAYYVIPCLCFLLFAKEQYFTNRNRIIIILSINIGLVVTASSQGIVCMAIIWMIWLFRTLKKANNNGALVGAILASALIVYFFLTNSRIRFSLSRINETGFNAVDARIGGYYAFRELSGLLKLFGTGFGNYNQMIYYSSIADILFCTGIIGFLLVAYLYFCIFRKGPIWKRIVVVASGILMTGGGIYTATYLCLYLPMLLYKSNE